MKKRLHMKMRVDGPQYGPKWAWWVALWLIPDAVKLPINVWFLSALTTTHEKGLDVTVRELLEQVLSGKITYYRAEMNIPEGTTEELHHNLNHCNAAGCDGVQCEPIKDHTKGDF